MPDIWGLTSIVAKFSLYLGILGSTGIVMILLIFWPLVQPIHNKMKARAKGLALLALIAAGTSFSLRGAALTGDASGLTDPEMLGLLWQTSVGLVLISRLVGMILMLTGLFLPRFGLWLSLFGGLVALWSFSQIGHIPDREIVWVRFLLLLHLLGIAFWIGVLSPLKWLSNDPNLHKTAAQMGHRFGQLAIIIVPALLLVGGVLAWVLLGNIWDLFATGYGQLLLGKIILVGVLLGLAALNKLRFIPAVNQGDQSAARRLNQTIGFEWLMVVGILAATAILTSVLSLP